MDFASEVPGIHRRGAGAADGIRPVQGVLGAVMTVLGQCPYRAIGDIACINAILANGPDGHGIDPVVLDHLAHRQVGLKEVTRPQNGVLAAALADRFLDGHFAAAVRNWRLLVGVLHRQKDDPPHTCCRGGRHGVKAARGLGLAIGGNQKQAIDARKRRIQSAAGLQVRDGAANALRQGRQLVVRATESTYRLTLRNEGGNRGAADISGRANYKYGHCWGSFCLYSRRRTCYTRDSWCRVPPTAKGKARTLAVSL